ncbi:MAG: hypothetical protein JRC68_03995 [Deltaproteobacteria bacterium]|nr:hypothetical protein [Deltaproteobacteria bacterium]
MEIDKTLPHHLLEGTIGVPIIEIVSNNFEETPGYEGSVNTYQEIVFQIKEEEPDIYTIGILYALSLMSFTYAAPRGYSAEYFIPDEQWALGYFIQGLEFKSNRLCFTSDYVSGRLMKTDISFESGGKVTLTTRNRGKGAERWLTHLQGKKHIKPVN